MKPIVRFTSGNAKLSGALNDRLMELTLTDQSGMTTDTLTITLDDREPRITPPQKGIELTVMIGYAETSLVTMGSFTVDETGFEGWPRTVSVSARAADLRESGIKAPKTRSFSNLSLGDLVKTIAGENGLKPCVANRYANEPMVQIDQTEESDLNLLTRLAQQRGGICKPAGSNLLFVEKGKGKAASGKKLSTVNINARDCSRYSGAEPDRGKYGSVRAKYYNVQTAEHVAVLVGEGSPVMEMPDVHPNEDTARAAATAKYKKLKRGQSTFDFSCVGDPTLQAEAPLIASGFGAPIDGEWLIESVAHSIGHGGYSCSVKATRGEAEATDENAAAESESEEE